MAGTFGGGDQEAGTRTDALDALDALAFEAFEDALDALRTIAFRMLLTYICYGPH